MKNKLYVILIIFLSYINLYPAKVYKAVRIKGIDTPEKRDQREEIKALAYKAQEELEKLLMSGEKITLYNLGRDKYFRLLASVRVGNIDVSKYMIDKGLAKKYDGGRKQW
ncbi:thermonuclease family protein [uncultured Brachyspira sp.]|uniref:thermonuclease family protein n=1 Tax=uncultured Brachyspira sp. TaxID=221953 RepID=UPI00258B4E21|nr:thermonuclease family protein [uncultured Brachyspira sp.]